MRQQVGALPIRWTGDEPRVLLVTSRETQRWIIPKGWRMRGRTNAEAAAQEALEEAGVRGRVRAKPIGRYVYAKRRPDGVEDCKITTYLLEVSEELEAFPEMDERQRAWFTLAEAEARADDEGLRGILHDLEPRLEALRANDRKAARKRAKAATVPAKASGKAAAKPAKALAKSVTKSLATSLVEAPDEAPAKAGGAPGEPSRRKRAKRLGAAAEPVMAASADAHAPRVGLGEATADAVGPFAAGGRLAGEDAGPAGDDVTAAAVRDAAETDARSRKRAAGKAARVAARRLRKARKAGSGASKGRFAPEAAE